VTPRQRFRTGYPRAVIKFQFFAIAILEVSPAVCPVFFQENGSKRSQRKQITNAAEPSKDDNNLIGTIDLFSWFVRQVDEMYREAPIKGGNFDYVEFTRILKHGKKDD